MPEPTHITGGESVLQAVGQFDRARSPSSLTASTYDASSTAIYVIEWSGRESLKAAPSWPIGPEPEREAALSAECWKGPVHSVHSAQQCTQHLGALSAQCV